MPLFHFVFNEDFVVEKVEDIELEDHEQALAEARQAAQERWQTASQMVWILPGGSFGSTMMQGC